MPAASAAPRRRRAALGLPLQIEVILDLGRVARRERLDRRPGRVLRDSAGQSAQAGTPPPAAWMAARIARNRAKRISVSPPAATKRWNSAAPAAYRGEMAGAEVGIGRFQQRQLGGGDAGMIDQLRRAQPRHCRLERRIGDTADERRMLGDVGDGLDIERHDVEEAAVRRRIGAVVLRPERAAGMQRIDADEGGAERARPSVISRARSVKSPMPQLRRERRL